MTCTNGVFKAMAKGYHAKQPDDIVRVSQRGERQKDVNDRLKELSRDEDANIRDWAEFHLKPIDD